LGDNIGADLRETGWEDVDRINLAEDRGQGRFNKSREFVD